MSEALLAVVAVMLFGAGAAHLRDPHAVRTVLESHDVLARRLRRPVALGLPLVELAVAVALLIGLGSGWTATFVVATIAAALLAAMTCYVHVAAARSQGRAVPCGCGIGEAPLGLWVTVRSGLLTALALFGALTVRDGPTLARPAEELVVMAAAVLALSLCLGALPAARARIEVAR